MNQRFWTILHACLEKRSEENWYCEVGNFDICYKTSSDFLMMMLRILAKSSLT